MSDELRAAVARLLGQRPSPTRYREMAGDLESEAQRLRRLAEAVEANLRKPPEARITTARKPTAGPGAPPSRWLRLKREPRGDQERLMIFVGRGLYYDLGSPARIDIQRLAGRIELRAAEGAAGWAVQAKPNHMPHFWADGAADMLEDLREGRYSAEVRGGAIVVGQRIESDE